MTIDDTGTQTPTKDFWDQVETSEDFNNGITGKKLVSTGHVKAEKPGETDWFRVYGTSAADIIKGLIVELKVDVIDQKFLVIGPNDFKQQIVDGFKKAKGVYLAYYVTSSGKQGVWPVTIPKEDQYGNVNAYVQTAFIIMERAQHVWANMKTNQGDRVYDGWIAEAADQEMFGDPQFLLTPKEANQKAFNDRVIQPDNYQNNPYVMRILNARNIETGVKVEK
ncbi:MAG: hypothetical protein HOG64_01210 [Flavobacteriaceae bacterium]|jgi:hypothetical protein|nr:hypothetical protein [Flavobacteriaceae bacterium]